MNSSATGGVLVSQPPQPVDDAALDAVFQSLVTSITQIDGTLVRPRWQPTSPKQPPVGTDWCAIGVVSSKVDEGPWIALDPTNSFGLYWRHEDLEVLATFYGPNSRTNASALRDGLDIVQNLEQLLPYEMRAIDCETMRSVPELVNEQWIRRQDLMCRFRRKVTRDYAILAMEGAEINLIDDTGAVDDWIYFPAISTPSVLPYQGAYLAPFTVTITADAGDAIYYTLDGTTPTTASAVYTAPLTLTAATTVKAVAVTPSGFQSNIATVYYTLTGAAPGFVFGESQFGYGEF